MTPSFYSFTVVPGAQGAHIGSVVNRKGELPVVQVDPAEEAAAAGISEELAAHLLVGSDRSGQ